MPPRDDQPNLDTLRSLAVTAVLIDHLVPTLEYRLNYHFPLAKFTEHIGHWGVMAFFVHTCLVLMHSLERLSARRVQQGGRSTVTRDFLVRRAFRIYPLSISCVLVALVLGLPAVTWGGPVIATWQEILANLLLVQNFWTKKSVLGPLWSLPYEVQMYLLLPFLYRFALRWSAIGVLVLIGFACSAGVILAITSGHLNFAAYVPCFLAGVLCFALESKQRALFPAFAWPLFLLVLGFAYCTANIDAMRPVFWFSWLGCLALGLAINMFRQSTSRWFNSVTKKIAQYSYGLYLWHVPVLHVVFGVARVRSPLLGSLAFVPLTLLASILSYHLIEEPLIGVGRKI